MTIALWFAVLVLFARDYAKAHRIKELERDATAAMLRGQSEPLAESMEFLRANQLKLRRDIDAMKATLPKADPLPRAGRTEMADLGARCQISINDLYPKQAHEI